MRIAENTGRKNRQIFAFSPPSHNFVGYIFPTKAYIDNRKKNSLHNIISSIRPHNMVHFGPLAAEFIGLVVWGNPANFNGFRVLASLLQRCHSTDVNQTLHDVWMSLGLVHCAYIFGGFYFITEFCNVQY